MNESASGTKVGVRTLRISAFVVAMILASCSSDATTEPKHPPLPTDGSVPADRPFSFEVGSHCGVGFLGLPVDGRFWITDEAANEPDWFPAEWAATQSVGAGLITITVELSADRQELTASLAGRSVAYRPQTPDDPLVECA